jgi:nitrite reductase/ring-hydroxylating ferredoxin subunit
MPKYLICQENELAEGDRKVVSCDGKEVGVFRVQDQVVAWFNNCPHMRGPVCQGRIFKRVLEPLSAEKTTSIQEHSPDQTHIVCPWHGYEFDLLTGEHPGGAARLRPVKVLQEDGAIYVTL